ncbi:MAG: Fur family transcriptional regulator [Vallitaleaceae bacterium]|nr:Fur family transcriptional regulator [Vallitaleaceae bacterium]
MQQLADTLKNKQLKVTPQRLAIYNILYNSKEHPTAEIIYQSLQDTHPTMSLATVYKTIDTLKKSNLIVELKTNGDSYRYDADISEHHHGICGSCGEVFDIFTNRLDTLILEVQKDTDFHIDSHHIYFKGTCPMCLPNNSIQH